MNELRRIIRNTAVLTVALAAASCASARDPSEPGTARVAEAGAGRAGMCDVRIENQTGETLELFYHVGGWSERLDETPTGRFHVVGVPCSKPWIVVYGWGDIRPGEGRRRFGRRAKIDVAKQTVVRLTATDWSR